ncbi:MAG: HNH endonuclease signature motif containing protein [Cyanobacteria bacterium J06555_13]
MSYIPDVLRRLVRQRAADTCEYCLMHQTFSMYSHEIDHAVAIKHGGKTVQENLVLACLPCNRHKGTDLTSIDALSGEIRHFSIPGFNFGKSTLNHKMAILQVLQMLGEPLFSCCSSMNQAVFNSVES